MDTGAESYPEEVQSIVFPIYFVCDASAAMQDHASTLTSSLERLVSRMAMDHLVDDSVMLSIITFGGDAHTLVTLNSPSEIVVPKITIEGDRSVASAIREYGKQVSDDYSRMKARGGRFFRPCIFFIVSGPPDDTAQLVDAFRENIKYDPEQRAGNSMYPRVTSFGLPGADERTVRSLAYPDFGNDPGRWYLATSGTTQEMLDFTVDAIQQAVYSLFSARRTPGEPWFLFPTPTVPSILTGEALR